MIANVCVVDTSGVTEANIASTAPTVITDNRLAPTAVAADSVRERIWKVRLMVCSIRF